MKVPLPEISTLDNNNKSTTKFSFPFQHIMFLLWESFPGIFLLTNASKWAVLISEKWPHDQHRMSRPIHGTSYTVLLQEFYHCQTLCLFTTGPSAHISRKKKKFTTNVPPSRVISSIWYSNDKNIDKYIGSYNTHTSKNILAQTHIKLYFWQIFSFSDYQSK